MVDKNETQDHSDLLDFVGEKVTKLFRKEHILDRFVCFYIMIGLYRLIMGFWHVIPRKRQS